MFIQKKVLPLPSEIQKEIQFLANLHRDKRYIEVIILGVQFLEFVADLILRQESNIDSIAEGINDFFPKKPAKELVDFYKAYQQSLLTKDEPSKNKVLKAFEIWVQFEQYDNDGTPKKDIDKDVPYLTSKDILSITDIYKTRNQIAHSWYDIKKRNKLTKKLEQTSKKTMEYVKLTPFFEVLIDEWPDTLISHAHN